MKTEIHLTCPCGERFDRNEISVDKAAQITALWELTHDGAVCFVAKVAEKFWRELREVLPKASRG